MRIIAIGKGEGKTTALVEYMLQPGNEDVVYVAPTQAQCGSAIRIARHLLPRDAHISPKRFLSAQGVLFGERARGARVRCVVDELDAVLHVLLGGEVDLGALTPSDLEATEDADDAVRDVYEARERLKAALDRLSDTRFSRYFARDRFRAVRL